MEETSARTDRQLQYQLRMRSQLNMSISNQFESVSAVPFEKLSPPGPKYFSSDLGVVAGVLPMSSL